MDAHSSFCCIIPAFKEYTAIPDQYVKKLAGVTLIQRALDTAKELVGASAVHVITDMEEVGLICRRNGVAFEVVSPKAGMEQKREKVLRLARTLASRYDPCVIFRGTSPLISALDIREACEALLVNDAHCLVSTRLSGPRAVREKSGLAGLLFPETATPMPVETTGLCILRRSAFELANGNERNVTVMPWPVLRERSIEITSYLDWWVCEKLLKSKHVVFVVAGYAAIGMGHIFRTLMLAHEIGDHRVTFLCTKESGLAAARIAGRDYHAEIQGEDESLAEATLRLAPDLVINDILDTDEGYMLALKNTGIPVVNFEDSGPGAPHADLVVNALYQGGVAGRDKNILSGYKYFCLRDEFINARRNVFKSKPERLLITFGGTDPSDYTRQVLEAVLPLCRQHGLAVSIVTGPGYPHIVELEKEVGRLNRDIAAPPISFTHATNIMSQVMEGCDMAISSAGRTVYELAHMRIPAIVLSQNAREYMHTFARPSRGFVHLGALKPKDMPKVSAALDKLLQPKYRQTMFSRMELLDFAPNKAKVMKRILSLLEKDT